jgi:tetratricopeptide (TPR) repeat protein
LEAARPGAELGAREGRAAIVGWSLAIAGAVFAAFLPALSAGFLYWDDDKNFLDHQAWRGLSLEHLRWMATTCHGGPYQPLAWLSLAVDHALFGMDPRGYHATNVALHALGAVVFFFLAARLLPLASPALAGRSRLTCAAVAALLFALHPLRVESVAWITERRDVLSGIFFCASIRAYLAHASREEGNRAAYLASLGLLLASLLAKASGIVMPAVLLLLDAWPLRRPIRRVLAEKIPFALIAAPFAGIAWWGQATQTGAMRSLEAHGILDRLAQASYAAAFYPAKTLFPRNLIPIRELPSPFDPFEPRFVACALLVVATTIVLHRLRRAFPAPWTAWAVYLVVLAPVSGLAGVGPQLVADRYAYLACMPFALLAAGAIFVHAGRFALPFSLVLAALLGALSWTQTRRWHDTETLFTYSLSVHPRSHVSHDLVGRMLAMRGRTSEAAEHYRTAIGIAPDHPIPRNNLGLLLLEEGRVDEAIEQFRGALAVSPDYAKARSHLGVALFRAGRVEEAEAELRDGVRRNPGDFATRLNLGVLLVTRERLEEAATELEAALAIDPGSAEARRLLAQVRARLQ